MTRTTRSARVRRLTLSVLNAGLLCIGACSGSPGPRPAPRPDRPTHRPGTRPAVGLSAFLADARIAYLAVGELKPRSVAFSPDGRTLFVGGAYGQLRKLDVQTGKELARLDREDELEEGLQIRLTPDGRTLIAAGYEDGRIRLYNAGTARLERTLKATYPVIYSLAMATAARLAIGRKGGATVWDLKSGQKIREAVLPYGLPANRVALSATGRLFALASTAGHLLVQDLQSGLTAGTRQLSGSPVTSLALHPDGSVLATGFANGRIQLFTPQGLQPVRTFRWQGSGGQVIDLQYAAGGRKLVAALEDGTLAELNARNGEELGTRATSARGTTGFSLSADGMRAALAAGGNRVVVLQSARQSPALGLPGRPPVARPAPRPTLTLRVTQQIVLSAPQSDIVSLAVTPRGDRLVLGHDPPRLSAWALRSKPAPRLQRLWTRKVPAPRSNATQRKVRVAVAPAGRLAFSHGPTDRLRRYSMANGWPQFMTPTRAKDLRSLLPTPDGKTLVVTTRSDQVHLFTPTGARRGKFTAVINPYWVGASPDSKLVVAISGYDGITVYSLPSGNLLWHQITGRRAQQEVLALRFSPDSSKLYTYHRTGFLRVYDARSGQRTAQHRIPTPNAIHHCDLRPDARVLACAGSTRVHLLEAPSGARLGAVSLPAATKGKQLHAVAFSSDGHTLVLQHGTRHVMLLKLGK